MTDLEPVLAELAAIRSSSEPIVSVYLDVRWRDEQQRERVRGCVRERARAILGHYPAGTPDEPALARTLDRIEGYVEALAAHAVEPERAGLALFACEGLGLWRPLHLAVPLAEELCADAIPHLAQLARVAARRHPILVVVPSLEGAELFEVRLGEVDLDTSVRGPAPRSEAEAERAGAGARGPERETKSERRAEAWALRNRRVAAERVTTLFDATSGARVILVGTAESAGAFARELPARVEAAIVAKVPMPRAWSSSGGIRNGLVRTLAQEVLGDGTDGEAQEVASAVAAAVRGGVGVAGPDDVVLAANEGRIQALFVEEDFTRSGFRCDHCGALGPDVASAEVCPFCQGELRAVLDLKEALVARTIAGGGRVALVAHHGQLHAYRGVAALLRQTAHTGLRGASPPWPTSPGASRS
ncbi:MAG TPA: hypothetical protein VF875_01155 [Anaeromyxobacter sp.]